MGASAKNARVSRAKANLAAAENRRNYTGKNLARSKRTARKALEFMSNPRSAIQNRSLGLGFRMPKTGRPKSTAKAAAKPAKAARKPKTETQTLQQADRLMGKLSKRLASINVNKVGLSEGLRQVRRNNARAGRVNSALNSRGLLGKYTKLTAPADAIRMTPAGPGIKQPKAATAKAAAKRPKKK